MRALLLVSVCMAVAAAGCGKKSAERAGDAGAGKPSSAQRQPGRSPLKLDANARQPNLRRTLAPIGVDEVKALLPAPAGARAVKPLAKAQVGERVEQSFCIEKGELAEVGAALTTLYTEAGWTAVAVRPNPSMADRQSMTGQKTPYRLFGSLQRGHWQECDGDKGQTLVTIGVHKLQAVEHGKGGAAVVPGAVGPSGTTGVRVP
jgi:hypothetical protein